MKPIMTAAQVKAAEDAAIEQGLGEDILIEHAAACVAGRIMRHMPPTLRGARNKRKTRVVIAVGGGNNGADGLSVARLLHLAGYDVTVLCVAKYYGGFAEKRQRAASYAGVKMVCFDKTVPPCEIFVDAMLGTGCTRPLEGAYLQIAQQLQLQDCLVVAVDIPSGVLADTGAIKGNAVCAQETVAFSAAKMGHFLQDGRALTGELTICDIGIRPIEPQRVFLLEEHDFPRAKRRLASHKYDYGVVKILAGCDTMPGAASLARRAASATLRSGAGLVTLCCPQSLREVFCHDPSESMYQFMPDEGGAVRFDRDALEQMMQKANVILLGPGLSRAPSLPQIIRYLAQNFLGTLVLDADALFALAQHPACISEKRGRVVLTPHAGEFQRFTASDSRQNIVHCVTDYAKRTGTFVLYKSDIHILTDGTTAYVNNLLTPALAKGGTGDVLSGMVAAYVGQKAVDTLTGMAQASLAYARAASAAQKQMNTENGVLASDLIAHI